MALYKGVMAGSHDIGRWETHLYLENSGLPLDFVFTQFLNWCGALWNGDGGVTTNGLKATCFNQVVYDTTTLYEIDVSTGRAVAAESAPFSPFPATGGSTTGPAACCAFITLQADATRKGRGRIHTPPLEGTFYGRGVLQPAFLNIFRNAYQYAFSNLHANPIVPVLYNRSERTINRVVSFYVTNQIGILTSRASNHVYTRVQGAM